DDAERIARIVDHLAHHRARPPHHLSAVAAIEQHATQHGLGLAPKGGGARASELHGPAYRTELGAIVLPSPALPRSDESVGRRRLITPDAPTPSGGAR